MEMAFWTRQSVSIIRCPLFNRCPQGGVSLYFKSNNHFYARPQVVPIDPFILHAVTQQPLSPQQQSAGVQHQLLPSATGHQPQFGN